MNESSAPFLAMDGVHKRFRPGIFKRTTIFDGLSCGFMRSQCTALLGHNGAGKTTLIRVLLGLIRPDDGQVLCDGHPVRREDRRRIGFMPEVSKMPADLTVEEALRGQLRLYGTGTTKVASRVDAKLAEVDLGNHRKKRIGRLSKGMARRVAWAQATIHEPEFLVLDEPFSGLDPLARQNLQTLMSDLRRKGVGMLVCTHEFWSVRELADQIYVINGGKLVYQRHRDDQSNPWPEERDLVQYFSVRT